MNATLAAVLLATGLGIPPLSAGDTLPPFTLQDQDGRTFSTASLRGDVTVMAFVYTRCRDARECPLETAKLAAMQRALRGGERLRILEITVDPARDTPAVLRAYGNAYGRVDPRWTLATGRPATLAELQARTGVTVTRAADGTFAHDDRVFVFDASQRLAATVDGDDWQPADLLDRARVVGGARASPIATLRLALTAAAEACGRGGAGPAAWTAIALLAVLGAAFVLAFRHALRVRR